MDRETLTQAVAMLVMLSALVRWLPGDTGNDPLGRGDPWRAIEIDRALLAEPPGSEQGTARLRAMMHKELVPRWRRILVHVRTLQAQTDAHDVVQVRGVSRNELWPVTYELYPARVVGRGFEAGDGADAPIRDEATWVLTASSLTDPVTLEPGPAGSSAGDEPPR